MNKLLNDAINLLRSGKLVESKEICLNIIRKDKNNFNALNFLGIIFFHLKDYQQSIIYFDKAVKLKSNIPDLYNNYSLALCQLSKFKIALECLDKATYIKPDYVDAFYNKANIYFQLKDYEKSIENYRQAIKINPKFNNAFLNLGNIYEIKKSYNKAYEYYEKSLNIDQNNFLAHYNKAKVLKALNRLDESEESYIKAITLNRNFFEAYKNLGNLYLELKIYDKAIYNHEIALKLNPDIPFLGGTIIQSKCSAFDWSNLKSSKDIMEKNILEEKKFSNPFPVISMFDSLILQKKVSEIYLKDLSKKLIKNEYVKSKIINKKIRVAYFSSDFHSHATSHLMIELFEFHDKDKFEIFAFSFGKDDKSEMRNRIYKSFFKFYDVSMNSNEEVINICRKENIDIAVDLKGFTENNRFELFIQKCAPIQVSYLGYPGTTGSEAIDYLIADKVLIPDESRKFYSEKIIYMPNSYQINEREKKISTKNFKREDFGLKKDKFVFCCFNQSYKILPDIFKTWVKILKSVNNSQIWLLSDSKITEQNIKKEFANYNIGLERVIFAKRMPIEDHLKRHNLADLFLDTYPCNAHTTASDTLRSGLPMITLMGETFASRVSASLLSSLDLKELITENFNDYSSLAIKFGNNPELLKKIKIKLNENIKNKTLFDSKLFTKNLEFAYDKVYKNFLANKKPDHIFL